MGGSATVPLCHIRQLYPGFDPTPASCVHCKFRILHDTTYQCFNSYLFHYAECEHVTISYCEIII